MINVPPQNDYACSGVFVLNLVEHGLILNKFFFSQDRNVLSPTSDGDQTHFNYFLQSNELQQWLEYRFQALWTYEVACRYPFLYSDRNVNHQLIRACIEASLFTNYFLHFAGAWYESEMWEQVKVFDSAESLEMFSAFSEYMKVPVYGKPLGVIKPKEN